MAFSHPKGDYKAEEKTVATPFKRPVRKALMPKEMTVRILNPKTLSIGEKLGKGSLGTVYKGTLNKQTVAIKVITDPDKEEYLHNEADALTQCNDPYILKTMG